MAVGDAFIIITFSKVSLWNSNLKVSLKSIFIHKKEKPLQPKVIYF